LSRLATSFVLGYHGCDRSVATRAVNGETEILQSKRDFDWLGPGAYFWESDPQRAWEWAQWKADRGDYAVPAVVGAVIDLRNCLDLLNREDLKLLKSAHQSFVKFQRLSELPIPTNRSAPGQPNADRILRFLDCAVFRHLHRIIDAQEKGNRTIEPFDTVRGMFTEGGRLYPNSGIRQRSHVQIAVLNNSCIRGIFLPL
jgi:hypothetical protein